MSVREKLAKTKTFVNRYGKQRVIEINDLKAIPKVAIDKYIKIFGK